LLLRSSPTRRSSDLDRFVQRCDADGDSCATFRCDADGDDCTRVTSWSSRSYNPYSSLGYRYKYDYPTYYRSGFTTRTQCDADGRSEERRVGKEGRSG